MLRTLSRPNKLQRKHTFAAPSMIAKQYFLSCECASSHEVCFYDIGLQSNFLCQKKKSFACETLRLRRVASATQFLSAAVRSPGGFHFIGNEVSYKVKNAAINVDRVYCSIFFFIDTSQNFVKNQKLPIFGNQSSNFPWEAITL